MMDARGIARTTVIVGMVVVRGAFGPLLAGPGTANGTQPVVAHAVVASPECITCHGIDYDPGHFIEPGDTWAGTLMAQSARDPLFWAALDTANHDVPQVGDFCLRCHAPGAWLGGRSEPPGGSTDGCGLAGAIDDSFSADFDGVTCHLCHRMMVNDTPPAGQRSFYLENAQFWIDDSDCGGQGEPCRRGPYEYAGTPDAPPPHPWLHSEYHEGAEICGNCHNVTNPLRNLIVAGVDQGIRFPIERTYREWEHSAYGSPGTGQQTCQTCHMPDTFVNPAYASAYLDNNRSGEMGLHSVVGGNSWVPEVLRQTYPTLLLDTELAAIRDAALDMLTKHAAKVDITLPGEAVAGLPLDFEIKVTNLAGHKLPTGFPEGRRMWLHVTARDGTGTPLWESGGYNAATGVLATDPTLKIYRAEHGIWDSNGDNRCDDTDGLGKPVFHFAANNCVAVDNRIPPLGFTGGNDLEVRPVNYAYPETIPGSGVLVHYDTTAYSITVPSETPSPVTISAELLYQTTSKEFVEFQRDEALAQGFPDDCIQRSTGPANASRGEILYAMWNSNGKAAPVTLASADGSAEVVAATPGEASGSVPMKVLSYDRQTGDVTISYETACGSTDHTVYLGNLSGVASMMLSEQVCGRGTSEETTFHLGSGNLFWVLVGNNGIEEGSYGRNSSGVERPENTSLPGCNFPQSLQRRCDPWRIGPGMTAQR